MGEVDRIKERYIRRDGAVQHGPHQLWDSFSLLAMHEKRNRLQQALRKQFAHRDTNGLTVLDVGCGSGGGLLQLLELGLNPDNLFGVELMENRAAEARRRLPPTATILAGDATGATLPIPQFDIIQQSTVFTSILDDGTQQALAERMWALLKPGGLIVWYDFIYDNPRNPDVRGVSRKRIRELFPHGVMSVRRTTLAPPLGRPASRLSSLLYWTLWTLPLLRSHVFVTIEKS